MARPSWKSIAPKARHCTPREAASSRTLAKSAAVSIKGMTAGMSAKCSMHCTCSALGSITAAMPGWRHKAPSQSNHGVSAALMRSTTRRFVQPLLHALTRRVLAVGRDGVFQIDDHRIRTAVHRPVQAVGSVAWHEAIGARRGTAQGRVVHSRFKWRPARAAQRSSRRRNPARPGWRPSVRPKPAPGPYAARSWTACREATRRV